MPKAIYGLSLSPSSPVCLFLVLLHIHFHAIVVFFLPSLMTSRFYFYFLTFTFPTPQKKTFDFQNTPHKNHLEDLSIAIKQNATLSKSNNNCQEMLNKHIG